MSTEHICQHVDNVQLKHIHTVTKHLAQVVQKPQYDHVHYKKQKVKDCLTHLYIHETQTEDVQRQRRLFIASMDPLLDDMMVRRPPKKRCSCW